MTPKQAAKALDRKTQGIITSAKRILKAEQLTVLATAQKRSSGTHTTAELRSLARIRGAGVYSIRKPDNRFDPSIANVQTSELLRGWSNGGIYTDGAGDMHAPVSNSSRHAGLFDGKPHGKMRARPLAQGIVDKVQPKVVSDFTLRFARIFK